MAGFETDLKLRRQQMLSFWFTGTNHATEYSGLMSGVDNPPLVIDSAVMAHNISTTRPEENLGNCNIKVTFAYN